MKAGLLSSDRRMARLILAGLIPIALLGTVMRYKIGFSLPWLEQKHLQEAHSHFAFAGWITQVLIFLMVRILRRDVPGFRERPYRNILWANLGAAYGMLATFLWQGYGPASIFFATASIIVFFLFAGFALRDLGRLPSDHPARDWWIAAIVLGLVSTVGTLVLTRMMVTNTFDQRLYLGSIYFYLHFQYNGWFFFACMGLLLDMAADAIGRAGRRRTIFRLLLVASVPAYFLSTLWARLPVWLYGLVITAAVMQVIALAMLGISLLASPRAWINTLPRSSRLLFLISGFALCIKTGLQLGSTHPEVSKLAFGFRHIVIAYLHLVLLLVMTAFLLGYLRRDQLLPGTPPVLSSLAIFMGGAVVNEFVLTLQGLASFSYTIIPGANMLLLVASGIMLAGALGLVISARSART